jgi:hypothetical protein
MYQRIVAGLAAGQPYYSVTGAALRELHYATAEPLNWRTPFLMVSLAKLGAASRPILITLAIAMCVGTIR